ncbi:MAG: DEAD/DEAH box helicase [Bacteroidia bacterium]|nr:DEAD/DEAH box helicase [Bacteroidia bacterium]
MTTANTAFSQFGFNKQIITAIKECGYETPTPVQQQAIPKILAGKQVIAIAHTGTGKTASYLLPLLKILGYPQSNEPRCLIVVPVHELCIQVQNAAASLALHTGLRIISVYGGGSIKTQREQLQAGCDFVIGTPGRLLELYKEGSLVFKKVKHLVIDEADKLLDMGFMPQLNKLFEVLPVKRQNLLFSATMNDKVKRLAENFIAFPEYLEIQQEQKTAPGVAQKIYAIPNFSSKAKFLIRFLNDENQAMNKVIVFCRTKAIAKRLSDELKLSFGTSAVRRIDGNMQQQARINAVQALNEGAVRILVATDIAARGLDIRNVTHVINFDVPLIYDDYIHRIGRTGRVFTKGESITYCTEADLWHWKKIEKLTGKKIPFTPLPGDFETEKTPYEEQQFMNRELDKQRRKDDPEYQGAFHEKKSSNKHKRILRR